MSRSERTSADLRDEPRTRAVIAVPLAEELCRLIEQLEPRLEVVRDARLTKPMRGAADWSGDPNHQRTAEEQADFDAMVDSADVLFGIPDVDLEALRRTVAANSRLQWVMTTAAGGGAQVKEAGLDAEALKRVTFTTSAGVHGAPLAEFAVLGVLAGAKDLPRLMYDQRHGHWRDRWAMRQVDELTVLVLGLGGIGMQCVERFRDLGARVWGLSRSGKQVRGVDRVIALDDLKDVIGDVDAIVIALPGTERTHHLVDDRLLRRVRPGVIIASVGRGSVLDESALLAALDDGRVAFAAMDVFEVEPPPKSSRLWSHPRVLMSPHTAALSEREEERIARRFAENATRLLDGNSLRAVVDTVDFY